MSKRKEQRKKEGEVRDEKVGGNPLKGLASKASRDKAPSVLMIVVRTISTMNKGTL
jgi:hypothetical protein